MDNSISEIKSPNFLEIADHFKNKTCLVTGHTGFKGAWITHLLKKLGAEVIGVSDTFKSGSIYELTKKYNDIEEHFLDIRNKTKIKKILEKTHPEHIFHFAAKSLVLDSWEDPSETFETNILGTVNVLSGCKNIDSVKTISVTTTDKVYKNKGDKTEFSENSPLWGSEPYSASKVGTEIVIEVWRKILKLDGVNVIALRAGNVIGGGDVAHNRLIPDFIRALKNDEKLNVRYPENTRPWQHVLDCIYGYLTAVVAIEKGFEFESINIGPRENSLSVKEIINLLKNNLSSSIDVSFSQDNKINIFTEAKYLELNSSFARNNLGWKNEYSAEVAVRITSDWWKNILNNEENIPYLITIDQINDFLKLKEFN